MPNAWEQRQELLAQGARQERLDRAQLAIGSAAAIDNHIQLSGVKKGIAEQTAVLRGVDQAVRQANHRAGVRHEEMLSSLDDMKATISAGQETAANQRYAQWRDGTEMGKYYHYTWRKEALRYLENYTRATEVYRAAVLLRVREANIHFTQQYPAPVNRADRLEPPRKNGPVDAVEIPRKKMMIKWGCGAVIGAYFASGALIALGSWLGGPIATFCYIATTFVILAGLFGVPIFNKIQHSRNVDYARSENMRRYNNQEQYNESVAEFNQIRTRLQREYERAASDWNVAMVNFVGQHCGVNITENWLENWTPVSERRRSRMISQIVSGARDNPPAHDDLIEIGTVVVDGEIPELYRDDVLSALPPAS